MLNNLNTITLPRENEVIISDNGSRSAKMQWIFWMIIDENLYMIFIFFNAAISLIY